MKEFQQPKDSMRPYATTRRVRWADFSTSRWFVLYSYLLLVIIATPYLPILNQQVYSLWPAEAVFSFIYSVEIFIGLLLLVSAVAVFFLNRRKFFRFIIIISGINVASYLIYSILHNPYELTHLPEYAIMSILILQAIKELEREGREKVSENLVYFQSAVITGVLGSLDEIYQGILPIRVFTWYDIFLNALGGVLGLTLYWGISRESVNCEN